MKAIRGATTVEINREEDIKLRTIELMERIIKLNSLEIEDIISIIFSVTEDLTAFNPATAFRERFGGDIPLFCVQEAKFQGSLKYCIRVLIHCNKENVKHCYLHNAQNLRPDLVQNGIS
ncbi:chorismate mutase [Anaerobranca gottschalkii]|uniref:chorismate mutase n=1 Tax=Anaerobranca gottschalkii DSM 13577 TaxID=1120990 RepID=A0A1H9YDM9_9FIRM|nr:chorismate mutase [Anaerobranca gottschalkii]SES67081.1 chorismate mutase [Anaerobranca gottschalkii DSM 13577]